MFEKSLYDLIRGLRNHKGNEGEYIQSSLKECRTEIKSQDMDKKATALLKLIYLEMFGYDMSWAAFHVLEVMSSQKYLQKRVGYLGAVQSFRPETEVLMLVTNLLKKDIVSPLVPTMSLPLLTLPHIISPSLALSLLSDLLPRLSHSNPLVRKKTVVSLYRLSLVYPEAFRVAWPKIKERLMDEQEDSSVTAAVINVVCELGWRRPSDFLPLAPRLFDLLVDGGNNWMAIKVIKLFASLTPLEPRLVRKLLRPLTTIIQTTSAMSLLYECINGVIRGGIFEGSEGVREGEVIAHLCVEKLRGMLVLDGDPNLKYVALLAFNRIVLSHPGLVSKQQDVIMDCLDDHDISIRLQALELVSGMVTSKNLQPVVNRLVTQLQASPVLEKAEVPLPVEVKPSADVDGEDPEEPLDPGNKSQYATLAIPDDYRIEVLNRILDMCSRNTYTAILSFEWYVDALVQLLKLVPPLSGHQDLTSAGGMDHTQHEGDIAARIGSELRNVAVRVKSVRPEATRAVESLLLIEHRATLFPTTVTAGISVLEPISWVAGEFSEHLALPEQVLSSLTHPSNLTLPPRVLSAYLQAIPKLFVRLTTGCFGWSIAEQNDASLLLARIVEFLEQLALHPDLDVQERATEFLELFHLTAEAISTAKAKTNEHPLLLSSAFPSLFSGLDLNPVATGAQQKVPLPDALDLEKPIIGRLSSIFDDLEEEEIGTDTRDELNGFYYTPLSTGGKVLPREILTPGMLRPISYQESSHDYMDTSDIKKRRADRKDRNKYDPFYLAQNESSSGSFIPLQQGISGANGEELDIDAIPIVDLDFGKEDMQVGELEAQSSKPQQVPEKIEIIADENIDLGEVPSSDTASAFLSSVKSRKPLLEVDSSRLGHLSLEAGSVASYHVNDLAMDETEEDEMARAMAKIERLRLEMQRNSEQIRAGDDIPPEGTVVKRKKRNKSSHLNTRRPKDALAQNDIDPDPDSASLHNPATVRKKKKKKRPRRSQTGDNEEHVLFSEGRVADS